MEFVYLFPGQGSQYLGMASSLCDNWKKAEGLFKEASDILGYDLFEVVIQGPAERLQQTLYTQPALFVHSMIIVQWLTEERGDIHPSLMAGHSLGELTALAASEAIDFTSGLNLVKIRAELMDEANKKGAGGMAAVLGLDAERIDEVVLGIDGLSVANYNSPNQTVITGSLDALASAETKLKEAGAKRIMRLSVGGAFHSALMKEASERFKEEIERTSFKEPVCPVISNIDGSASKDGDKLKRNLSVQMISPVRWTKSMRLVRELLPQATLLEIGAGSVLKGLAKQTIPDEKAINLDKWEDLISFTG
jgi:[acyl-carrier-protein] S-malonyltransferase